MLGSNLPFNSNLLSSLCRRDGGGSRESRLSDSFTEKQSRCTFFFVRLNVDPPFWYVRLAILTNGFVHRRRIPCSRYSCAKRAFPLRCSPPALVQVIGSSISKYFHPHWVRRPSWSCYLFWISSSDHASETICRNTRALVSIAQHLNGYFSSVTRGNFSEKHYPIKVLQQNYIC